MNDEQKAKTDTKQDEPPKSYDSQGSLVIGKKKINYKATAGWLHLYEGDKKTAELFHTYYRTTRGDVAKRPVTFVFNGGPGAASAFLHVGALGPVRTATNADGTLPAAPVRLVDNQESWLPFTDLVFVDPVGTGLSRTIKAEGVDKKADEKEDTFYWDVENDLTSLCDFISNFLSKHGRWRSPIYLAGESYGGYRTARLVRMLQEKQGVGLNGAFLISPAMEWDLLFAGRFNTLAAATRLPSLAAAARFHGRSKRAGKKEQLGNFLKRAEAYALAEYLSAFAQGPRLKAADRKAALEELSQWIGLTPEVLEAHDGRTSFMTFCRELLRDRKQVMGWYDASYAIDDPLPAAESFKGVDPTLGGIMRLYVAGANAHLRENLGLDAERKYELLSMDTNQKWQWSNKTTGDPMPAGAVEDLAVGISMNPDIKLSVVHGVYDLITPYFESKHLVEQLAQGSPIAKKIGFEVYEGGHMFYMWEKSRKAFTEDARKLIAG